jgi:hypothetical protein
MFRLVHPARNCSSCAPTVWPWLQPLIGQGQANLPKVLDTVEKTRPT